MDAKLIFDVATKSFPPQPIWSSGGALTFGCVLLLIGKLRRGRGPSLLWGYFFIASALVCGTYYYADWHISRHKKLEILADGQYKVLEGPVENFRPMPDDGTSGESFAISGYTFSYSDYDELEITPCFNHTAANRGPIRRGMELRVKFVDQCILQIEALPQNRPAEED